MYDKTICDFNLCFSQCFFLSFFLSHFVYSVVNFDTAEFFGRRLLSRINIFTNTKIIERTNQMVSTKGKIENINFWHRHIYWVGFFASWHILSVAFAFSYTTRQIYRITNVSNLSSPSINSYAKCGIQWILSRSQHTSSIKVHKPNNIT